MVTFKDALIVPTEFHTADGGVSYGYLIASEKGKSYSDGFMDMYSVECALEPHMIADTVRSFTPEFA